MLEVLMTDELNMSPAKAGSPCIVQSVLHLRMDHGCLTMVPRG